MKNHYRLMRTNQSVEFVERMNKKVFIAIIHALRFNSSPIQYGNFDNATMTIREAFAQLDGYVDSSDPDADFPNIIHSLQTGYVCLSTCTFCNILLKAEGIRKAGMPDWFQLVGLLHDMGKIMYLWGRAEDGQQGTADGPQWALGGDTWVVGYPMPDCGPFEEFNHLNVDVIVFCSSPGVLQSLSGSIEWEISKGSWNI